MSDDPRPQSRPFVIHEGDEADPGLAPEVPEALPEGAAMQAAAAVVTVRAGGLWSWAGAAFGLLFSFVLSVAAWDFVTTLLARNAFLGWLAGVLIAVAVGFALLLALREYAAYARLQRLDSFRDHARQARAKADIALARRVTGNLARLYAARPDTAWGRARFAECEAEVMDADALLALAEHELLSPLDARAKAEVEEAARRVALVTALVPLALADVAAALFSNLRMIRRLAEIYGGRSGTFGSLGLLRRVFTSLIATGAVALTDDLMGSVAGGGILSKLSRRFGEGVVNGALTARVGVAAMELCRPLPFVAVERPGVSGLVSRALTGLVPRG